MPKPRSLKRGNRAEVGTGQSANLDPKSAKTTVVVLANSLAMAVGSACFSFPLIANRWLVFSGPPGLEAWAWSIVSTRNSNGIGLVILLLIITRKK